MIKNYELLLRFTEGASGEKTKWTQRAKSKLDEETKMRKAKGNN